MGSILKASKTKGKTFEALVSWHFARSLGGKSTKSIFRQKDFQICLRASTFKASSGNARKVLATPRPQLFGFGFRSLPFDRI